MSATPTTPTPRLLFRWHVTPREGGPLFLAFSADAATFAAAGALALGRLRGPAAAARLDLQCLRLYAAPPGGLWLGRRLMWAGVCPEPWPADPARAAERLADRSPELFSIACSYLSGD